MKFENIEKTVKLFGNKKDTLTSKQQVCLFLKRYDGSQNMMERHLKAVMENNELPEILHCAKIGFSKEVEIRMFLDKN